MEDSVGNRVIKHSQFGALLNQIRKNSLYSQSLFNFMRQYKLFKSSRFNQ
jgi:hypothetical protein